MCYIVLLSTTADADLSAHNADDLQFSRDIPALPAAAALLHPHRWYVGSHSGCSCEFRHLHATELGFGDPVEWYDEDAAQIEATRRFMAIVRRLVDDGAAVDCVDTWTGSQDSEAPVIDLDVSLSTVPDSAFRFFENHHFRFGR